LSPNYASGVFGRAEWDALRECVDALAELDPMERAHVIQWLGWQAESNLKHAMADVIWLLVATSLWGKPSG